jgi:hypothetical protein
MKLKNIITLLILSVGIVSCSHKNEFGQRRINFNIHKIKPNSDNNVYRLIDTTKLYLEVSIANTLDSSVKQNSENNLKSNPSYLKFYSNGRVGEFKNIDFKNIETFNPKRAESYLYKLKNNKLTVQVYFKHTECGQCFIKKEVSNISNETIELTAENYIYTYKKVEMPQTYLIYKPDW